MHILADLQADEDHARILADGPVAFGAHARVDQDLRHGVARRGKPAFEHYRCHFAGDLVKLLEFHGFGDLFGCGVRDGLGIVLGGACGNRRG